MSTVPTPNSRASLLSGLRTGGVRSTSSTIPHTAAIGGSFGLNRFSAQPQHQEEDDHVLDLPSQNAFANLHHGGNRVMPMTAAVDGPNNSFIQQQRGLNPASVPFSPGFNNLPQSAQAQNQAFQMQMMQLEILKMQAIQAQQAQQQYQAELLAQAQRQQEQQAQVQNKPRLSYNPPATAGPAVNAFDLRSATLSAQMRRANQEQAKSHLSVGGDGHVPMTAALGGRFGARAISLNGLPPMQFNPEIGQEAPPVLPHTPNSTTVISGGTSLGSPAPNNLTFINTAAPSKSDSASSWRRGGQNNSVLRGLRSATSPSVRITPPPLSEQVSSDIPPDSATPSTASTVTPSTATGPKFRPQPLRFSMAVSQPMPSVLAVDTTETNEAVDLDDSSSNASSTKSHSTSPTSASSAELSPREEASKKLYEGLGIGRPRSAVSNGSAVSLNEGVSIPTRIVSQPMRHPKGPPSGADELGPQNFATRIRRKAIGGLGVLIDARERREVVAY